MNIMLNEEDFRCLVRGGIICVTGGIHIALQDIGFDRILLAVCQEQEGSGRELTQEKDIIFK
jgi:hypothetical protein